MKKLSQNRRHVLGVSGGKDSSALAIYMRDKVPEMEYVFCDTGKELPETYEYLDRLEAFLGKKIERLNEKLGFDHWLDSFGGLLPSPQVRWCTRVLKIEPFQQYIGKDYAYNYIAIRADEDRTGYKPLKSADNQHILPVYPFKEDGITRSDVSQILEQNGLGLPDYYSWRTRSGCYFCFYQRKSEWVGLKENHPELFESSKGYEKKNLETGESYNWCKDESLEELEQPERIIKIKDRHEKSMTAAKKAKPNQRLMEVFGEVLDDEDDDEPCLICQK